jgi:hypothetical protein
VLFLNIIQIEGLTELPTRSNRPNYSRPNRVAYKVVAIAIDFKVGL